MTTVDLPKSVTTTSAASTWQMNNTAVGDTMVIDHPLTWDQSPLVPVGRKFCGPNAFVLDDFPAITAEPNDATNLPQIELRSAQAADGTWHGGQAIGLDIAGPNTAAVNGRMANGKAHGIYVDPARPHPELCQATFCRVRWSWIDLMYGPGTALACNLTYAGRHGRTMHWDQAQLVASFVDHCGEHPFAAETPHRVHGAVIDQCTFGGKPGYWSTPVSGWRYTRNHSRAADGVSRVVPIIMVGRFGFNDGGTPLPMSDGVAITDNVFESEAIVGHISEGIQEPAVWVQNVTSPVIERNTVPCYGPFARLDNCPGTPVVDGNIGGAHMTAQV